MHTEDIIRFIRNRGYRTFSEIRRNFLEPTDEVLKMHLKYTIDKGLTKKIDIDIQGEKEVLYYVPYKK